MKIIKGITACSGIVIAKAKIIKKTIATDTKAIDKKQEKKKLDDALKSINKEYKTLIENAKNKTQQDILTSFLSVINDKMNYDKIVEQINKNKSAVDSIQDVYSKASNNLIKNEHEHFKQIGYDLINIQNSLIDRVTKAKKVDLGKIKEEVILISEDFTPNEIVQFNQKYIKGFITERGGANSHNAIVTRTLNLPALVATKSALKEIKDGTLIILDGFNSQVIIEPTKKEIDLFTHKIDKYEKIKQEELKYKGERTITYDNVLIELGNNINNLEGVIDAIENDADAIGLLRTEFIYIESKRWPTEEEQFLKYKKIVEKMNKKRVIIRTLDIGGDKFLNYHKFKAELNPFLGERAIRFSLKNVDIFKTQLRAIIRASYYGRVNVLFPMITEVNEFRKAKELFNEAYEEVVAKKQKCAPKNDIKIGAMIETPAAAILSYKICNYADFISVGSNDLIQYCLAADRSNESVSNLYKPTNPAVINLLKIAVQGARVRNKWAGICGQMASDYRLLPLIIGLGFNEISVNPNETLRIRKRIGQIKQAAADQMVRTLIYKCETPEQVDEYIDYFNKQLDIENGYKTDE